MKKLKVYAVLDYTQDETRIVGVYSSRVGAVNKVVKLTSDILCRDRKFDSYAILEFPVKGLEIIAQCHISGKRFVGELHE